MIRSIVALLRSRRRDGHTEFLTPDVTGWRIQMSTALDTRTWPAGRSLSLTASRSEYRPDVDGLRAVAAVSVIGIHVGLVRGGFTGVDVFFVISGFLISGILLRSLADGQFSLIDFYIRRIRRIFPALITVLLAVWALGWLLFLPYEFRLVGRDLEAGSIFVMNLMQAWYQIPEFPGHLPIRMQVLNHLWTLGIEEQFYLVWPLFLLLIWKLPRARIPFVVAGIILSFVSNIRLASTDPDSAYGMPWAHFWQFACGGILAYAQLGTGKESGSTRPRLLDKLPAWTRIPVRLLPGVLGAALLIFSCAYLDATDYPGWWELAPTAGASLLIAAGPHNWVNRNLLSNSPMVFVGKLSYSLYLWHYPLIWFARLLGGRFPPPPMFTAGAVLASFILAYLTYRYIEQPLRTSQKRAEVAVALCAIMAATGLLGYLSRAQIIPARPLPLGVDRFAHTVLQDWLSDTRDASWTFSANDFLTVGKGPQRTLFLGDSAMQQYYPRIAQALSDHPLNAHSAVFATWDRCAPAVSEVAATIGQAHHICKAYLQRASALASDPTADTIVVAACWYCYLMAPRDAADFGESAPLKPGTDRALSDLERMLADWVSVGKRVYVVLDTPIGIELDPRYMIRRTLLPSGFRLNTRPAAEAPIARVLQPVEARVSKIAHAAGVQVIDPMQSLCDHETCPTVTGSGEPVYHDTWHLNPSYVKDQVHFLDETILDFTGNSG